MTDATTTVEPAETPIPDRAAAARRAWTRPVLVQLPAGATGNLVAPQPFADSDTYFSFFS
jgi:hypothetical protein